MLPYQIENLEGLLGKLFEGSDVNEVKIFKRPFVIMSASECCTYNYTSING